MSRRALWVVLVLVLALGIAACNTTESADEYPNDEIDFIIPFEAGSSPDSTARTLAAIVEENLGEPIVIRNVPGGGASIGVAELAEAEPDGYTIGFAPMPPLAVQPHIGGTPIEGPDDVAPIAQTNAVASALIVHAESEIETIEDFVNAASEADQAGEPLQLGMNSTQNVFDMQIENLMDAADFSLEKIEFGPGGEIGPLVNQTVEASLAQPIVAEQYVQSGDLRIIGFFGEEKPEGFDEPLFVDEGYPEVAIQGYEFVLGPPGMDDELVEVIADAFRDAVESEEFTEFVTNAGGIPSYAGPDELADRLATDAEEGARIVEELGWE